MVGIYFPGDFLILDKISKTNGEHATSRPIHISTTASLKVYVHMLQITHMNTL